MKSISDDEDESSEESGEKIRNVRSLLIKTSDNKSDFECNYVFKRKLGDLIFDAHFEGGNLGLVEQIDRFTYDLMVRPDVANPRFRSWFNFTVSNQLPNQCVIFSLVNLSETINLFNQGLTPVVRSRHNPNWIRLSRDQVFYYRSPEHSFRRILSIAFRFDTHSGSAFARNNEHQFALFYPYTISRLEHFVTRWSIELKRQHLKQGLSAGASQEYPQDQSVRSVSVLGKSATPVPLERRPKSSLDFTRTSSRLKRDLSTNFQVIPEFKVKIIAESVLSKPVYQLGIEDQNCLARQKRLKVIFVGGWSGNFESITAYICQGLLDFALDSQDPVAQVLRQHVDIVTFPIPDPDSSWSGNSRSDIFGQANLTQQIAESNPRLYANILAIRNTIKSICEQNQNGSVIILHSRVNANLIGTRVVGRNYSDDTFRMERHLRLPRLFSTFIDGFYLENCRFPDASLLSGRDHLFDVRT